MKRWSQINCFFVAVRGQKVREIDLSSWRHKITKRTIIKSSARNSCLRWNATQTSRYNDDNREQWTPLCLSRFQHQPGLHSLILLIKLWQSGVESWLQSNKIHVYVAMKLTADDVMSFKVSCLWTSAYCFSFNYKPNRKSVIVILGTKWSCVQ